MLSELERSLKKLIQNLIQYTPFMGQDINGNSSKYLLE
jgi:hypothetical protein